MHATLPLLQLTDFPRLQRKALTTLQVNLGYQCNQTCLHCHVNAGPTRKEMMDAENLALIPEVIRARSIQLLDLTGGAPEMHPGFRDLVRTARQLGVQIIDRCNLTILFEPQQEDLAQFLAQHQVEIVASLPCYSPGNVDKQRGDGVFAKSIMALKQLNALGYGQDNSGLTINLVYNPQGAALPPGQQELQADYKRELASHYGIVFNRLFTITNMPIKRFGSTLVSRGEFVAYMDLLKQHYNANTIDNVMCRNLISVDWQGYLYDCDFNQQLELPVKSPAYTSTRPHLRDLLRLNPDGADIVVADHCYACTAGSGSSCGGALENTTPENVPKGIRHEK